MRLRVLPPDRSVWVERFLLILGAVIYVAFYLYLYSNVIVRYFSYMGLQYQFTSGPVSALCLIISILPTFWLPLDASRPSHVMIWFLYIMVYVPGTVTPVFTGLFDLTIVIKTAIYLFVAFALLSVVNRTPLAIIPVIRTTEVGYERAIYILTFVLLVGTVAAFGVPDKLPTLADVYGIREMMSDVLEQKSRMAAYLPQWLGRVATTLLLIYGIVRKKTVMVVLAFVAEAVAFSLLAEKSLFFHLIFILLVMLMLRGGPNRFGLKVVYGTVAVLLVSHLFSTMFHSQFLSSLAIRRVIVTPGLNTAYFFEYFSYFQDKVHFAYNLLKHILPINLHYGYDYSPARMAGMTYITYNKPLITNMNANLWADGFANFGFWGVLFNTLALSFVLWIFDSITYKRSLLVTGALLSSSVIGIANASMYTQLLTNGLALVMVFTFFLPSSLFNGSSGSLRV